MKRRYKRDDRLHVPMPQIPKDLLNNPSIAQVLLATVEEFYHEEKSAIYMYCLAEMSVREIARLTEQPIPYVMAVLRMYAYRLAFKVDVFEKILKKGTYVKVPVRVLFELESEKWAQMQRDNDI